MLRGIVEQVVDTYHVRVRMPRLNKLSTSVGATPTNELSVATLCTVPGCSPNLRQGDIVYIDFEDDDEGVPIVVGMLFNERGKSTYTDYNMNSLKVNVNAELPGDTSIGQVSKDSIACLQGLQENVQLFIESCKDMQQQIQQSINDNSFQVFGFDDTISQLQTTIDMLQSDIEAIKQVNTQQTNSINSLDSDVSSISTRVSSIEQELSGALILNSVSYGTADPSTINNPKEGQLYLHIQ